MKRLILIILMALASSLAFAQNNVRNTNLEVTGRVVDTEGNPMIGVAVYVPTRVEQGVITGTDGSFKVLLNPGESFLEFSFIDYPTKTVKVDKADKAEPIQSRVTLQVV